jgi:Bacterial TSP3 repeat
MIQRRLISLVLASASLLVASADAHGAAVLGVRLDPGAREPIARLHRLPAPPALAHGLFAALASTHSKPSPLPTITSVRPLKLAIGKSLTILGRNFVAGKHRDTIVFLRSGAPAVFLRADTATTRRITLTLTSKLTRFLTTTNTGAKAPTRFRLRVLARRFGAQFTSTRLSPTVLPAPAGGGGPSAPSCSLASAKAAPNADADGDGLSNALELSINTDPCNADTDGDGITDGYEYQSALDLNSRALPYPGKRPYPNALDPTDAGTDYDGDGLTQMDEYTAWVRYGGRRFPLNYSDGTQMTGGPQVVTPATAWEDINGNGFISDDEKDIDNDGLTNWDEAHGPLSGPGWWAEIYKDEKPFPVAWKGTDWLDPDTDGDGLKDGADDVDHDGWTNAQEVTRGPYAVQPFNPCLPDYHSPTCPLHPPLPEEAYPPFSTGYMSPGEPTPLVWPRPSS